ncbi:MAG: hypothetical protein ACOYOK_14215 [Pseudobdellovibrionaceae bacterium]
MKLKSGFSTSISVAVLALYVCGCASIHSGNYAKVDGSSQDKKVKKQLTESKILASGLEVNAMSSKYYTMIDFTFENQSSKWIQVNKVDIDFGSDEANQMIEIPVTSKLVAWSEAAQRAKAISDYNTSVILSSVGVLGAGLAASSNNSSAKNIGGIAAIGAAGTLTINSFRNNINNLELSKLVPDSHLLSAPFFIPAGMFTKKWMTIYTQKPLKTPYISDVTLTLYLENGKKEKVVMPIRDSGFLGGSSWQRDHYSSPSRIRERERNPNLANKKTDEKDEE